jgi:uncharacterized membrane protein YhaH (DUF805 family)/predicted RNA-binding Zn-ribbon protein involved in translation (DUF1610 family)
MSWYLRVLEKYFVLEGRARRKEFWMFYVFFIGFTVLLAIFFGPYGGVSGLYYLAMLIPNWTVSVRRLHDSDHSGWFVIVPFYNLYLFCIDGTSGDNRFGPDPKGAAIGPTKADFIPDSPIYRDSPPPAQVDAIAQSPEDSSRQNVDQSQSSVLLCSECGHENPAEVNFCTKCRAKMTLECNKCGFKSPQGSEFCGSCGEETEFRVEKRARNAALAAAEAAARVREAEARTALIPVERYFDNGHLEVKGGTKGGKSHGPYERYYKNGQLRSRAIHKNGEQHGPYEHYDENGKLGYRGTYNMGSRCGTWIVDRKTVTYPPCPRDLADGN